MPTKLCPSRSYLLAGIFVGEMYDVNNLIRIPICVHNRTKHKGLILTTALSFVLVILIDEIDRFFDCSNKALNISCV